MHAFLGPLLAKVLDAVTPETIADWSSCISEISVSYHSSSHAVVRPICCCCCCCQANRDPTRLHWLFQLLMADPLNGKNGSFKDARYDYLSNTVWVHLLCIISPPLFPPLSPSPYLFLPSSLPPSSLPSSSSPSRLFLLQCLLAQQEWRVPTLLNHLVPYLQTHMAHSYKNVRERIGR